MKRFQVSLPASVAKTLSSLALELQKERGNRPSQAAIIAESLTRWWRTINRSTPGLRQANLEEKADDVE